MRHLASAIALSLILGRDADDDRRRADAWRELHRRPDAMRDPVEPVEPVRSYRRYRVSGFSVRSHRHGAAEG